MGESGRAVIAADRNTSGTIELTAFPSDPSNLSGADVTGQFAFETEDAEGNKISVQGSFSFKAK